MVRDKLSDILHKIQDFIKRNVKSFKIAEKIFSGKKKQIDMKQPNFIQNKVSCNKLHRTREEN